MDPNTFVVIFQVQDLDWPVSRDHILLQLHYRNVIVAVAEIEIRLTIIVDENIWVDRTNVASGLHPVDKRFAQGVLEGTCG